MFDTAYNAVCTEELFFVSISPFLGTPIELQSPIEFQFNHDFGGRPGDEKWRELTQKYALEYFVGCLIRVSDSGISER